jgi:hypothetical protein
VIAGVKPEAAAAQMVEQAGDRDLPGLAWSNSRRAGFGNACPGQAFQPDEFGDSGQLGKTGPH